MKIPLLTASLAGFALMMSGCSREEPTSEPVAPPPPMAEAGNPTPYVVEVRAVGKTFEAPTEIPSGWITFDFVNASSMLHFALIDMPPPEATMQELTDDLMIPFQEAMDAMNAGDEAGVNAAFGKFPAWIGELVRAGGPGLLSPGRTGRTTIHLAPGRYIMECYVKSDGIFHTTPPAPGENGMVLEFTVTEEDAGAPEPEADVTLTITNQGFVITEGELHRGPNTIRVDFTQQQALPSFVGNDVHVMQVDGPDSIALADGWMDWRTPEGLEDPLAVTFLGGLNDLPEGQYGYFTVDLAPGDYAFIAEMPSPQAAGFVLPFSID